MSEVPVLGGLNADIGKLGRFFGLRRPLVTEPCDGRGFWTLMMTGECDEQRQGLTLASK